MKKILLFAAAAITAVSVSAQQKMEKVSKDAALSVAPMAELVAGPATIVEDMQNTVAGPKKSKVSGVYYAKPSGAMYYNWNKAGSGYGPTYVIVPARTDIPFKNLSTDPTSCQWRLNGSKSFDFTEDMDKDGNITLDGLRNGYAYAAPTVSNAAQTDSFCIGKTTNTYWSKGGDYANYYTRVMADSLFNVGPIDDHCGQYGWGSLSSGWLYGNGMISTTYKEQKITGTCYEVRQSFPKPMAALYCEDMYIRGKSAGEFAIPEGKQLKCYIVNTETNQAVYELVADSVDAVPGKTYSTTYTSTGTYTAQTVTFSQKSIDAFGNENIEPFVIDFPYMVAITGLDQEGIDLGWNGADLQDQDEDIAAVSPNTFFLVEYPDYVNAETGKKGIILNHRYSNTVMAVTFDAMFDGSDVVTELYFTEEQEEPTKDVNVVKISNDGETCANAAAPEYLSGAYVHTFQSWFDEEDNEYYYLDDEEMPEWLTEMSVAREYSDYTYDVAFKAEALPEGVEGRGCMVYLYGRAGKSNNPIYILQGNYTKEMVDGIKVLLGDANGDEAISVADLAVMASFILGEKVEINEKNADVNNDGEITVADLAAVANMILGAE